MHYQFLELAVNGLSINGHSFDLPNDDAALAKANELAQEHDIEIWKGALKLGLVFSPEPVAQRRTLSRFQQVSRAAQAVHACRSDRAPTPERST